MGGGAEVFSASDTLKKDHGVFPDGSQLKGTYFWDFFILIFIIASCTYIYYCDSSIGWSITHICFFSTLFTAKTQYQKFETNYPKKGIAAQSPNSYTFPWSVCLFCCKKKGGPNVGIYSSQTHECIGIGTKAALFLYWEYTNSHFFAVLFREEVSWNAGSRF